MTRAILVTGPVGSGKTTTLLALDELLAERGEPYALVDLDWLCWVQGAPVEEVLAANLGAVRETYARAGVERLVLARSLVAEDELSALRSALPGVELCVVRLAVPRDVLERRIRLRDTGRELEEHLRLLGEPEPGGADATVDATREPALVARAVLAAAGW